MGFILNYFSSNEKAVTSIGILLTLLLSAITLIFTVRNNKAIHYINTITKSRVEWINKLRYLSSQYISVAKVSLYSPISSLESNERYEKLIQLSLEIRLMLNFNDDFDKEIMNQTKIINELYENLLISYSCINECGERLFNHKMNEEVVTNPSFIKYLYNYALSHNINVKPFDLYIGNVEAVVDLYLKTNNTSQLNDEFLDELMNSPENLLLKLNGEIEVFVENIQIYLKNEWNRAKMEAGSKKFTNKKKAKELEQFLSNKQ